MQILKKFQLTENRIGILIIIGVIVIYHLLVFKTEIIGGLPMFHSRNFRFVFMIIPGFFAASLYAIFTKKIIKIFGLGILTIIFWYIWLMIYALLTYKII